MGILKKFASFIGWCVLFSVGLAIVAAFFVSGKTGSEDLEEVKSKNAIGLVELKGQIISSEEFRKSLKKFEKNDKIKGLVIRIETPGGAVGASEEIYRAIKDAAKKKPVVCSLGNVAASGGVYAAVGCQKIVTNKGTLTGSVGVILMTPNITEVTDKVGFKMNVIKTGRFKDAGSPFRDMGEADQNLLQSLANASYEQFVAAIADGRGLSVEAVKSFSDGRIILGEQAVDIGLADEIGGVDRAAKLALELSGVTDEEPELVREKKPEGIFRLLETLDDTKAVSALYENSTKSRLLFQAFF